MERYVESGSIQPDDAAPVKTQVWSAVAARSGDTALDLDRSIPYLIIQSAVAAALGRRTPNSGALQMLDSFDPRGV